MYDLWLTTYALTCSCTLLWRLDAQIGIKFPKIVFCGFVRMKFIVSAIFWYLWNLYTCTVLAKKKLRIVRNSSRLLREAKSQTHRDCIIVKFTNSVNTYAHTYDHHSCAHFVNFANVSMQIAQTLHEHTLLMSLREVFACVSLPFFFF